MAPSREVRGRRPAAAGVVALAALLAASALVCERGSDPVGGASAGEEEPDTGPASGAAEGSAQSAPAGVGEDEPARDIADYGEPAPTLFFVAGLKGYTEPCGCTAGLNVGGLDRVVGFIRAARERQPASLVVDAGNLLFGAPALEPRLVEQERLKAPVMVAALERLGTVTTTPGPYDLALGLDFYLEQLSTSGIAVVVANLSGADGRPLGTPSVVRELGPLRVGIVGAVDPGLFEHRDDVRAEPAAPAVRNAVEALEAEGVETIVLVMQGDLEATRALVAAVSGVDFAVVGLDPAETDEVVTVEGRALLQAYDQGRYVGLLKLYPGPDGRYLDARVEDRAAIDRVDRRLAYLRNQLALLPPYPEGQEPAIVRSMRREADDLEAERQDLRNANLVIPESGGAFIYWPVALEPGYPEDAEIAARMDAFNASLQDLHAQRTAIVPLGPDDTAYAGSLVCAGCHEEADEVWLGTPHATAIDTLEARDKAFDESCVGCHVTGFRRPSGAVTGNHNGLANVQCEACHGPGQDHVLEPENAELIVATPRADACVGCHNHEHSPTFDYVRYLPFVLGPGHGPPPAE